MGIKIYPDITGNIKTSSNGSQVLNAEESEFVIRNSKASTSEPTSQEGNDGDVWFTYE